MHTQWWVVALRLTGVGWYVVVCVLGGVLGGLWLDKKFGVLPLFTLSGVFLGVVVAGLGIYRMVEPLMRDKNNQNTGSDKR